MAASGNFLMHGNGTSRINGSQAAASSATPRVEIDKKGGLIRISDSRLITKGRRTFCRRLIHAIARRPGVRKVVVDLGSASCRVEFAPGSNNPRTMAAQFADSVDQATKASLDGDGTPWWQPSTIWVTLTAYVVDGDVSLWETIETKPGQIRIRHQGLAGDFERLNKVAATIARLDQVTACQAIPWSHRLTIDFSPENGLADWFIDQAQHSFEGVRAAETPPADSPVLLDRGGGGNAITQVATGPARWLYLAMGGGALVMTVVGLIVPGIPTVPFLLLSSYGFARSSPGMNRWLRDTKFLGPILTEWENHGGLSRASKRKLIGLTGAIILIAVILAPLSPLGLILILVFSSLSLYGLSRLPGIAEENAGDVFDHPQSHLALAGR